MKKKLSLMIGIILIPIIGYLLLNLVMFGSQAFSRTFASGSGPIRLIAWRLTYFSLVVSLYSLLWTLNLPEWLNAIFASVPVVLGLNIVISISSLSLPLTLGVILACFGFFALFIRQKKLSWFYWAAYGWALIFVIGGSLFQVIPMMV
jgi:hypothetical protein